MAPAIRNRTLVISDREVALYRKQLLSLDRPATTDRIINRVINQDLLLALPFLPAGFVDLLFIDPPYNLTKRFGGRTFNRTSTERYRDWLESWFPALLSTLAPNGSVYLCGDWRGAAAIQQTGEKYLRLQNRITFEREKGRGSRKNWKNAHEDIWFFTKGKDYYFDAEAVKLKRRVIAPYRENGRPKDWTEGRDGNFRLTHASNLWTDITVPFWSMPENTPHPTQKSEKLLAKLILASTPPGAVVLDPFAGVGTAGVAAIKLGRRFVMIEVEEQFCLYAIKRLDLAATDTDIQGYGGGVFWERNTRRPRPAGKK